MTALIPADVVLIDEVGEFALVYLLLRFVVIFLLVLFQVIQTFTPFYVSGTPGLGYSVHARKVLDCAESAHVLLVGVFKFLKFFLV